MRISDWSSDVCSSDLIKVLEAAGLVRRDVRGRTHVCSLDPAPLMRADQWIGIYRRFWTDRLDVLEKNLRADDAETPPPRTPSPRKTVNDADDATFTRYFSLDIHTIFEEPRVGQQYIRTVSSTW